MAHTTKAINLTRFNPLVLSVALNAVYRRWYRVPMFAWWPGKIALAKNQLMSVTLAIGWLLLPDVYWWNQCHRIAIRSVSCPRYLEKLNLKQHEFLYWELHEGGFKTSSIISRSMEGIRSGNPEAPVVLYDQQSDIAEKYNVAEEHPEIAAKIGSYLQTARSESADWVPKWHTEKK